MDNYASEVSLKNFAIDEARNLLNQLKAKMPNATVEQRLIIHAVEVQLTQIEYQIPDLLHRASSENKLKEAS